jgi:general secretion pathway protein H
MGPISRAGRCGRQACGSAGFILVEQVATLVLIGLLVLLAFPTLAPGTGQAQFHALWMTTATLLRDTRSDAIARGSDSEIVFDRRHRVIQSRKRVLELPDDVDVRVSSGVSCATSADRIQIVFRANGTSCGGVIQFAVKGRTVRIRVNWLTGQVALLQDRNDP